MNNEQIRELVVYARALADQYENNLHDSDELFSECLMFITESILKLNKTTKYPVSNLKGRIKKKIESTSQKPADTYIDHDADLSGYEVEDKYSDDRQFVESIIDELPPRAQLIIKNYYGFYGSTYTLREIAEMTNLSADRVKQIRDLSLVRLKHKLRTKYEIYEFSDF